MCRRVVVLCLVVSAVAHADDTTSAGEPTPPAPAAPTTTAPAAPTTTAPATAGPTTTPPATAAPTTTAAAAPTTTAPAAPTTTAPAAPTTMPPAAEEEPLSWQGGIRTQYGFDSVRDEHPLQVERAGASVQLRFIGVKEITRSFAIGGHLGLGSERHGVERKNTWQAEYVYLDPGIDTRISFGRFALQGWLSYVVGERGLDGGLFSSGTSSVLHGPRAGATALVGVRIRGLALEAGPFVEVGTLSFSDDENTDDIDESQLSATSWKVGLAIQVWAGRP